MDLRSSQISDVISRVLGSQDLGISGLTGTTGLTPYLTVLRQPSLSSEVNGDKPPAGAWVHEIHGRMGAGTHPGVVLPGHATLGTPPVPPGAARWHMQHLRLY